MEDICGIEMKMRMKASKWVTPPINIVGVMPKLAIFLLK